MSQHPRGYVLINDHVTHMLDLCSSLFCVPLVPGGKDAVQAHRGVPSLLPAQECLPDMPTW